jgi:hypothetical protein
MPVAAILVVLMFVLMIAAFGAAVLVAIANS